MVESILRERVYVDQDLNVKEIQEKYVLSPATAYRAKRVGYFCKNYNVPQVWISTPLNKCGPRSYSFSKRNAARSQRTLYRVVKWALGQVKPSAIVDMAKSNSGLL